jgi:hypothetical protein
MICKAFPGWWQRRSRFDCKVRGSCEWSTDMTKTKFFASVLCITCLWSFASNSAAQTSATETNGQHGSICVLPNSAEPPTRISPRGDYSPDTLKVRLDRRDAIRWPHRKPVLIDDMGLEGRHLIVLTSDGKRIASLRFRFARKMRLGCACISTVIKACN